MGKSKCRHLSWPSPWENPVAVVATCRILPALVASSTRDGKQAKSRPHPPSDVNSGHASRRTNRSAFANVLLGRCKRTGEPVGALGCVGASGMSQQSPPRVITQQLRKRWLHACSHGFPMHFWHCQSTSVVPNPPHRTSAASCGGEIPGATCPLFCGLNTSSCSVIGRA